MRRLKNEFAFSFSRYKFLQECPRKFYMSYYGSWEGWDSRLGSELAQKAYRLKQLTGMYMWVGNLVHDEINRIIQDIIEGQAVDYKKSLKRMGQQSKREFDISIIRSEDPRSPPKMFGLKEHEYGIEITPDFKAKIWGRAQICLANFFGMGVIELVREVGARNILSIDDFSTFPVIMDDGYEVKVYSVPDLALRQGRKILIWDWKTGQEKPGYEDQVALYALFGSRYWNVNIPDIEVNICYLLTGNNVNKTATPEWIENAEQKIKDQSKVIMTKLVDQDPQRNVALPISEFPISESDAPCRWCSFEKICGVKEYRKTGKDPLKNYKE